MTWPALLILFYGYSLSSPYGVGKVLALGLVGLWLVLGGVYRVGVGPGVYLAAITAATFLSKDAWVSFFHLWGTNTCGLLAALLMVPFWVSVRGEDRPGIESGIRLGAVIMSLWALAQIAGYLLPYPLFSTKTAWTGRAYSSLGNPVYLGAMCALCFPFAKTGPERLLLVGCLWTTGSRGAWAATGLGMAYFWWPAISNRVRVWGLVVVGVLLCAAFWIRPMSDLGRIVTWDAALSAFKTSPWVGWGTGNFVTVAAVFRNPVWEEAYGPTTQDHAHNFYLEALSTGGLVGLAGILCLHFTLWKSADRFGRAALLGVWIVGLLNPLPLPVKALCLAIAAMNLRK